MGLGSEEVFFDSGKLTHMEKDSQDQDTYIYWGASNSGPGLIVKETPEEIMALINS